MEDYSQITTEELIKLYNQLNDEYVILDGTQMSIKLAINSMYGVFANQYFYFFSYAIAESIPGQGRHITKTTGHQIHRYFTDLWVNDVKLHKQMGLTSVKPISKPIVIYSDTDSVYYDLTEVYNNTEGWKFKDDLDFGGTKFALDIYKFRLSSYIDKFFEGYANKYKTTSLLDLEMEKISRAGTFLSKKKYALDISWKSGKGDGYWYPQGDKFVTIGGEVVMTSTPKYIREKLKEFVYWMLGQNPSEFPINELMKKVQTFKKEFELQDYDIIAKTVKVTDYEKFVISDNKKLEIKKGIPYHIRASSYYNHILNSKYAKFKGKYPLIKSGDKVKWYPMITSNKDFPNFAYIPNSYPYEFAPKMDIDTHFNDSFLTPLNRYVVAMGQPEISNNFFIKTSLF
jgi:DNA polymerase elongation subunit (family B)